MEVTLEDAYAEACRMLGEAIVKERLMVINLQQQQDSSSSQ